MMAGAKLLLIMDGFGYRAEREGNAIAMADTPNFDRLWREFPHTLLEASGEAVGLPAGQMGNSEVGHLHIGAGRLVRQELTRIDAAIESGEFAENSTLNQMLDRVLATGRRLHVMGLLSDGGVHSHLRHWQAMLALAAKRGVRKLSLHLFLDGRDTPPQSAERYIKELEAGIRQFGCGHIASLSGRFYAMDRDQRWDRVQQAYDLLVNQKAVFTYQDAIEALQASYAREEFDEFVRPTIIASKTDSVDAGESGFYPVQDGDFVMFMNFRADRARELCVALTDPNFSHFETGKKVTLGGLVTLTSYADDLPAQVAFPPHQLHNTLGEVVAAHGLQQLRLAETEKYAHVTYFINGGKEEVWQNERRILVPSPKVATYDLQPEMSAREVTEQLLAALDSGQYQLIICNYANPDMVGHTGKLPETIRAIEFLDQQLGLVLAKLQETGGEMVLIADHGNAEKMVNSETGKPYTAHTTSAVPCIYYGSRNMQIANKGDGGSNGGSIGNSRDNSQGGDCEPAQLQPAVAVSGGLIDVAPTMLYLMGIAIPEQMSGTSVLQLIA